MCVLHSYCNLYFSPVLRLVLTIREYRYFVLLFCVLELAACSVYPIPDDVLRINTEDIVRHARCEMRTAVIESIIDENIASLTTEEEVVSFVKATQEKIQRLENKNKSSDPRKAINIVKRLTERELAVQRYMGVAVVYSFDFNITENNVAAADAAFQLPFTGPGIFDLGADSALNLIRQGQRQFKAQDAWASMIIKKELCKKIEPRHPNLVYPLDGSIGVGHVARTFIDISNQGGAKDSFVDTLVFTTEVGAGVNAAVKLNAVPHSLRLVAANARLQASRIDIHKVIISLVFPRAGAPDAITGVDFFDGYLNAPFDRPPDWRARYNLCVADAREREDSFKKLRESPPEIYCIAYADAFAPQYGPEAAARSSKEQQPEGDVFPPPIRGYRRPNVL